MRKEEQKSDRPESCGRKHSKVEFEQRTPVEDVLHISLANFKVVTVANSGFQENLDGKRKSAFRENARRERRKRPGCVSVYVFGHSLVFSPRQHQINEYYGNWARTQSLVLELLKVVVLELFAAHLDGFAEVLVGILLRAGSIASAGDTSIRTLSQAGYSCSRQHS